MPKRDWETWMWQQAEDLLREAENIHRGFLQSASACSASLFGPPSWGPPVNLFETEEAFWAMFALPGVDPEDLALELSDGWITLSGRRSLPAGLQEASLHVLEIPTGPFERRIQLPGSARVHLGLKTFEKGILLVELRKVV